MGWASGCARLFWPRRCVCCAEESDGPICARCAVGVTVRPTHRCTVCDGAMPVAGPAHRCGRCLARPPRYDRAWGVFEYDGVVGEAIRAGKYQRAPGALAWVAATLAAHLPDALIAAPPAVVVPVPLHWRRVEARRCAPPLVLAVAVARRLGVPCRRRAVRRLRDSPEQVGLDADARRRNLRGAFAALPIDGDVLVVDDVMTTGATLSAVAACLRDAGAPRVRGLAAARVD